MVLKRARLYEQVADILETRIRDRDVAPGEELPSERDLMKEFGVGRPAVREALFHLDKMGLVELRNGARARVKAPSPEAMMSSLAGSARYLLSEAEGIRHFQDARILFETGLVRDAVRMATAEDIENLERALAENLASTGNLRKFEETDVGFHYAIAVIPQNPIYRVLHSAILEWLMEQRHVTLNFPGQLHQACEAHKDIFAAIKARDEESAARKMRGHLEQVRDHYWKVRGATP